MTRSASSSVRDALVLAAGNGDRFQAATRQSKLLHAVLGEPMILRTLATAAAAGIGSFEVILGYEAESVRRAIERGVPAGTSVSFIYNPDWRLENGVSVLAARSRLANRRFALLMGDHLFDPAALAALLAHPLEADESVLAIDTRAAAADVAAEATQVRLDRDYITAIGKDLGTYDALDTGLFVCSPVLFGALDRARADGDTTLSGGIQVLAGRRLMRGVDVGGLPWYDIDTVADLAAAERVLSPESQPEPA